MVTANIGPDAPSADHRAMCRYWDTVDAILGGEVTMRAGGERFLPKFPNESSANYSYRRDNSKLTNVFRDVVENLAAKPFSKPCSLLEPEKLDERITSLSEDIDGRGNNMHVFASRTFFSGIAKAFDGILIDFPKVKPGLTLAQEKAVGARPYWAHVPAENIVAAYTAMIDGKEQYVHVRLLEPAIERQGYEEVCVERVRVLNREPIDETDSEGNVISRTWGAATFEVYEKRTAKRGLKKVSWVLIDQGPITIGVIPFVIFATGRRKGTSMEYQPALQDCAELQVQLYQEETNLKLAKEQTCFPMLAANGITPPLDKNKQPMPVPTGPGAVLYAPMADSGEHGEWKSIEPGAQSLKFLSDECKETAQKIRELGRQPLTAQTGNLTVVTTAFAAQKGNSAAQSWALALKDSLEQAWMFTCMWLKQEGTKVGVSVFTDFSIENDDGSAMTRLISMAEKGKLSNETLWEEGKRRGELSAEFTAEREWERLREQGPDPLSEADITGARQPKTPAIKKAA